MAKGRVGGTSGALHGPVAPRSLVDLHPRRSRMTYLRRMVAPAARLVLSFALTAAAGCAEDTGSFHSPAATRAPLTGAQVDARALVLSAGAGDANAVAITA